RLRVYPNTSITVFSMAEGPDGFLWLAATDGLYRFDGFHYHKITSFPFGSARYVAFTRDGSMWCGSLDGATRFRNGSFDVVLSDEVDGFAAYPDQLFVRLIKGFVRIGLDGSMRRVKHLPRRDLTIDPSGRLWFSCIENKGEACWLDPGQPDEIHFV